MVLLTSVSSKLASQYIYWRIFHKKLNLKNPQTFNEKLMKLKLERYEGDPLIKKCVDKYSVRSYVAEQGCSDILIPLLGVWNNPKLIPFERLPQQFVLKCNHGCGYNIICTDKDSFNVAHANKMLYKWLHEDFWRKFGESNYKAIEKKIICESFIGTDSMSVPIDYKFYCFHGIAKYVMACCERNSGNPTFFFFDRDWKLVRINHDGIKAPSDFSIPKPEHLEKMFFYADKLSQPFPFVRVDLYETGSNIYFGEMTFTPSAALDTERTPSADKLFCSLLDLS